MKNHSLIFGILLLAFFVNGLENILTPPLDANHPWRQTLTIGMAREFVDHPNIFYPRTIIGNETEIFGSEFPLFSYCLSLLYRVFGFQHWYGRMVNWIFYCAALYLLFKMFKHLFTEKIALFSTLIYMSGIATVYARNTMPDIFSFSLNIAGLYLYQQYFMNQRKVFFILFLLLSGLSWLVKLPYINISLFALLLWHKNGAEQNELIKLAVGLGFVLVFSLIWYFGWVPHLVKTYGNQLIWSYNFQEGYGHFTFFINDFLLHLTKKTFFNLVLFFISIIGLGGLIYSEFTFMRWGTVAYIGIFIIFGVKSGNILPTHDYYFIPITIILALGGGYVLNKIPSPPIVLWCLTLILIYPGIKHQKKNSFIDVNNKFFLELPGIVNKYIPLQEKILVNGGAFNPYLMYWTGRTGWTFNQDAFVKEDWILDMKKKYGLKYLVQSKKELQQKLNFKILFEDGNWVIYGVER